MNIPMMHCNRASRNALCGTATQRRMPIFQPHEEAAQASQDSPSYTACQSWTKWWWLWFGGGEHSSLELSLRHWWSDAARDRHGNPTGHKGIKGWLITSRQKKVIKQWMNKHVGLPGSPQCSLAAQRRLKTTSEKTRHNHPKMDNPCPLLCDAFTGLV